MDTANSRYNGIQGTEEKVRHIEVRRIKTINQQNSFLTRFKGTFRCRVFAGRNSICTLERVAGGLLLRAV